MSTINMQIKIKGKKAQDEGGTGISQATWLALIVVAIIILIPVIYKETAVASDLTDTAACYASLLSPDSTAKCPIVDYTIYKSLLQETKDGKTKESEIVKSFTASEDKINQLFTKLMGNCLQMGGGANSAAFSRNFLTSSKVCLECSNIRFDSEVSSASFGGLRDYLEKSNVPGTDKKYAERFTRDQAHREDWINYGIQNELLPGKYSNTIDKDKTYTLFFLGIKEGTATAVLWNWRLIGREDTYFVYASTQDNFNKICDRKVN